MYVIFTYITFHCVTVYFLIKYIITRASQFPGGLLLTIERQIKFLTVNFKIQRKWSRKSCNFIKQKKKHSLFHQARQQFSSWHIKNNSGWRHWCSGPKHFSKSAACANGIPPTSRSLAWTRNWLFKTKQKSITPTSLLSTRPREKDMILICTLLKTAYDNCLTERFW